MRKPLITLSVRIVVLTLMFAFATSGFAHRFMSPTDVLNQRAVLALGYSAGDICGDSEGDGAVSRGCEACLFAAGFALPPANVAPTVAVFGAAVTIAAIAPATFHASDDANAHPARAPPIV